MKKKITVTDCIACFLALAVALFGAMLVNCRALGGDLPAPCDSLTLAELTAECRTKVRAQCERSDAGVVDPTCPIRIECDKRVDAWHDCKDAGAPERSDGGSP